MNGAQRKILTRGKVKVFSVLRASVAVQKVLLPSGHTLLVTPDAPIAMDVPGRKIEASRIFSRLFQLIEITEFIGREFDLKLMLVQNIHTNRNAIGVGCELKGGKVVAAQNFNKERV